MQQSRRAHECRRVKWSDPNHIGEQDGQLCAIIQTTVGETRNSPTNNPLRCVCTVEYLRFADYDDDA